MAVAEGTMVGRLEPSSVQSGNGSCSVLPAPAAEGSLPSSGHSITDFTCLDSGQVPDRLSEICPQNEVASRQVSQEVFIRVMPCPEEGSTPQQTAASEEQSSSVETRDELRVRQKGLVDVRTSDKAESDFQGPEPGLAGQNGESEVVECEGDAWEDADSEGEDDGRVFVLKLSPSPSPRSPGLSALSPTATQTELVTRVGVRERVEVLSPLPSSYSSPPAVPSFSLILREESFQEGLSRQVSGNSVKPGEFQPQHSFSEEHCQVPDVSSPDSSYVDNNSQQVSEASLGREAVNLTEPAAAVGRDQLSSSVDAVGASLSQDRLTVVVEPCQSHTRALTEETHQFRKLGSLEDRRPAADRGSKRHCSIQAGGSSNEHRGISSASATAAASEGYQEGESSSRFLGKERNEAGARQNMRLSASNVYDSRDGETDQGEQQALSSLYCERGDHKPDPHQASRMVYRGMNNPLIGQAKPTSAEERALPPCTWEHQVDNGCTAGERKHQVLAQGLSQDDLQPGQAVVSEGHSAVQQYPSGTCEAALLGQPSDLCMQNSCQGDKLGGHLWEVQRDLQAPGIHQSTSNTDFLDTGVASRFPLPPGQWRRLARRQSSPRGSRQPSLQTQQINCCVNQGVSATRDAHPPSQRTPVFFGDSRTPGATPVTPQPVCLSGSPFDPTRANGGERQAMSSQASPPQVTPYRPVVSARRGSASSFVPVKPDELLPSGVRYDAHKKAYRAIVRTSSGAIKNRSFSCNKYGVNHARFLALEAVRRSGNVNSPFSSAARTRTFASSFGATSPSLPDNRDERRGGNQARCGGEVAQAASSSDASHVYGSGWRDPAVELTHYSAENSDRGSLRSNQAGFDSSELQMNCESRPGPTADQGGHKRSGSYISAYCASADFPSAWTRGAWHHSERARRDLIQGGPTVIPSDGSARLTDGFSSEARVPVVNSGEAGGPAAAVGWGGCASTLCTAQWQPHGVEADTATAHARQNAASADPGNLQGQPHLVWGASLGIYNGDYRTFCPATEPAMDNSESPVKVQDVEATGSVRCPGFQGELKATHPAHHGIHRPVNSDACAPGPTEGADAKSQMCTDSATDGGDGGCDVDVRVEAGEKRKKGISESEAAEKFRVSVDSGSSVQESRSVERRDSLKILAVSPETPAGGLSGSCQGEAYSSYNGHRVRGVSGFEGSAVPLPSRHGWGSSYFQGDNNCLTRSCPQSRPAFRRQLSEGAIGRTAVTQQRSTEHDMQQDFFCVEYGAPRPSAFQGSSGSWDAWTHMEQADDQATLSVSQRGSFVPHTLRPASSSPGSLFSAQIRSSTRNLLCSTSPHRSPPWTMACCRPSPDAHTRVYSPRQLVSGKGTPGSRWFDRSDSGAASVFACHRDFCSAGQDKKDEPPLDRDSQKILSSPGACNGCRLELEDAQAGSHDRETAGLQQRAEKMGGCPSSSSEPRRTEQLSFCHGDCLPKSKGARWAIGSCSVVRESGTGAKAIFFSSKTTSEDEDGRRASGYSTLSTISRLRSQGSAFPASTRDAGRASKAAQVMTVLRAATGTALARIESVNGERTVSSAASPTKRPSAAEWCDSPGSLRIAVRHHISPLAVDGIEAPGTAPSTRSARIQEQGIREGTGEGQEEDNAAMVPRVCSRVGESRRVAPHDRGTGGSHLHDDTGSSITSTQCEAGAAPLLRRPAVPHQVGCFSPDEVNAGAPCYSAEGTESSLSGGISRVGTAVHPRSGVDAPTRSDLVCAPMCADSRQSSDLDTPVALWEWLPSPLFEGQVDGLLKQLACGLLAADAEGTHKDESHSGANPLVAVDELSSRPAQREKGRAGQLCEARGAETDCLSEVTERGTEVRDVGDELEEKRVLSGGSEGAKRRPGAPEFPRGGSCLGRSATGVDAEEIQGESSAMSSPPFDTLARSASTKEDVHEEWRLGLQRVSSGGSTASQSGPASSALPDSDAEARIRGDIGAAKPAPAFSLPSSSFSSGAVTPSPHRVFSHQRPEVSPDETGSLSTAEAGLVELRDSYGGKRIEDRTFSSGLHRGSVSSIATITSLSDRPEVSFGGMVETTGRDRKASDSACVFEKLPQWQRQYGEEDRSREIEASRTTSERKQQDLERKRHQLVKTALLRLDSDGRALRDSGLAGMEKVGKATGPTDVCPSPQGEVVKDEKVRRRKEEDGGSSVDEGNVEVSGGVTRHGDGGRCCPGESDGRDRTEGAVLDVSTESPNERRVGSVPRTQRDG